MSSTPKSYAQSPTPNCLNWMQMHYPSNMERCQSSFMASSSRVTHSLLAAWETRRVTRQCRQLEVLRKVICTAMGERRRHQHIGNDSRSASEPAAQTSVERALRGATVVIGRDTSQNHLDRHSHHGILLDSMALPRHIAVWPSPLEDPPKAVPLLTQSNYSWCKKSMPCLTSLIHTNTR